MDNSEDNGVTPPGGRKGDCEYDRECPASLACFNYNCKDPCIGTCGQNTKCEVTIAILYSIVP